MDRGGGAATGGRGGAPAMALALLIGAAGGAVFAALTLPLPWMLGAMAFTMAAAVMRAPIRGPGRLRPYVVVVIGVMLGSGFTPDLLGEAGRWAVSFALLAAYLALTGALVVPYYRRVAGYDPRTAYFAAMPGGLNEMIEIGRAEGGDERAIALAHACRVFLVVVLIAFWFRFGAGVALADRSAFGVPFAAIPARELALLALCGLVGFLLGPRLGLPAPTLVGPMLASAAAHVTGIVESPPPSELVVIAQVMLGTILGCRFLGAEPGAVGRALLLSLGATGIMLAVSLGFALAIAGLVGQDPAQVMLAYAPGGLAEMSLVALAMDADVAYVASHHTVRIAMVILAAPIAFRLIAGRGA